MRAAFGESLSELARIEAEMKVYDSRWEGLHGIGRFATEVGRRLNGFDRISLSGSPSAATDVIRLTRYLRAKRPKFYLSPGYNAPLGEPCPFAFCVHDLNHLVVRSNSNALKRAYYRTVLKPALHRARIVLTVSEFTRRSICEWADLPESQVCNVGNGVSEVFKPGVAENNELHSPYFLYVGNHKPHKNFNRLIEAFALSSVRRDYLLVATGSSTRLLRKKIEDLQLENQVRFLGEVSDLKLASLYRGATALVLVSLYEGFGLPLAEAMSCGTPVITSTLASMPEVVADAAIQVDPLDISAIAGALTTLASDSGLRDELRLRGIARAKYYSWDATGRRVEDALSSCE